MLMRKLFTLMFTAMALVAAQAATYTVAGAAAVLNGDASWAETNEANDMTTTDNVNYTLTVSGISVEAGSYEYKVVEDHDWTNNWPSSNAKLSITETAKYDIVYTFNADTKAVGAEATKVGAFEGSTEKTYTVAGDTGLMGNNWDISDTNHDMTKDADGIYRLLLENVALTAGTYAYKVAVNHDWGTSYPSSNATLTIATDGNYNVEFTFNEDTKAVGATATAVVASTEAEATFDFENNPEGWPVGEGVNFADGNLTEPLTVGEVTLTNVQGDATQPARIMRGNDGINTFYVYKNGSIKFSAADGRAITKIAVTMKSNSFDLAASTGSVADNVWTGNATEVLFTASATRTMLKIVVTTDNKNSETVEPAQETYDVEAANIAAFNAAEDGKVVKLTLTDAKVNGNFNGYYVEDASGATVIKGIALTVGKALNGYIIGTKATKDDIDYMGATTAPYEPQLQATDATTFEETATTLTGKVTTVAEAGQQSNYGRLITLENVTISGSGQNKTLTDAEGNTIKARDYMGVLSAEFTWPEKASKITGVVIYYMTGWFLLPISADAIVAAGEQSNTATFDFTTDALRSYVGTSITDVKSYIINETYTVDNVQLQITGGSAPSRITNINNRGNCLTMYKEYSVLKFTAPEGYGITKIEFTLAGTGSLDFTPSSGQLEGLVWTGWAEGVRFVNNATPYIASAVVTLASTADMTTPVELKPLDYTHVNNIAEFNALDAGTYAEVDLYNAEVIGISADGYSTVFVQDETGGTLIQYSSLNSLLQANTKVSGVFYVVKRVASGNSQMKETENTPSSRISATSELSSPTTIEGTIADVNKSENLGRVVKITDATLTKTSATAGTLAQGDTTIDVNNGSATANQQLHKIAEWTKDEVTEHINMVAILVASTATKNQLLPISIADYETAINAARINTTDNSPIYNLQGVRQNSLKRGINIVGGRKIVK